LKTEALPNDMNGLMPTHTPLQEECPEHIKSISKFFNFFSLFLRYI